MGDRICEALGAWLEAGARRMGQVSIEANGEVFRLRHWEDVGREDLAVHWEARDAQAIAQEDDAGNFRALKTAPTLRHGWELRLEGLRELREALDFFHPAMLGVRLAAEMGSLRPVCLRDTFGRQSGMYAVTRKLCDEDAEALIGRFCRSDSCCLKTILWKVAPDRPVTSLPAAKFDLSAEQLEAPGPSIAMPCQEACNFLVAEARRAVRKES